MSVFVARILNSENDWESVSILKNTDAGVTGFSHGETYQYGFEHWLNNDILKELKIGYIDCYRDTYYKEEAERVILINFDGNALWYVGDLSKVRPLRRGEIASVKRDLEQRGWLKNIRGQFNNIGDIRELNDNHEYMKHYNAKEVVGEPQTNPFVLNIRYAELNFLQKPIDLILIYPEIKDKWMRLSNRFKTIPPQLYKVLGI